MPTDTPSKARVVPAKKELRDQKRTVYALVIHPFSERVIPPDLSDFRWKPWINCTPSDIASGLIASMVGHRAFRTTGGPAVFLDDKHAKGYEIEVVIFDPAQHHTLRWPGGAIRIGGCYSTTLRFTPR